MNLIRFPFCKVVFSLISVWAASSMLCLAQTPGRPSSGSTLGYTVVPGASTPIYLTLIPSAECKLREKTGADPGDEDDFDAEDLAAQAQEGDSGKARQSPLKLFSDSDGNARFFAEPPATSLPDDIKLVLRCVSPGARARYIIKLRGSDRPTADMPFPLTIDPALNQSNQTVLPPLSGDPASMTDQEIMLAGYPARPDPIQSPDEYALWLSAVSKPISVVTAQATPSSNLYHSLVVSPTWSGFVLEPQTNPYVYVFGHWNVPKTVTGELFRPSEVSEWIGLDGNSGPIIQAGTNQAVLPAGLVPFHLGQPHWILTSYDAWTEVYPLQPSQVLPNLPVHPGDTIECAVWISSDNLIPTLTGGFAYFDLFNLTTNQSVRTVFEIAQKFNFSGHDAEWIVERPSIGPTPQKAVPTDLSNYHSVCFDNSSSDFRSMLMRSPVAWTETGANQYNKFPYTSFTNDNWNMFIGPTFLSGAYPDENNSICYQWINFH